jgi:tRNA dimethylallyltransferase
MTDGPTAPSVVPVALALVGPTASGKTALSLELAGRLDGEIVSMDSRQVYRGMDIGTAKPTAEERARVPHHGLDRVDPVERYSAGRFAREARRHIAEIRARGRVPILVGGTGFFLRALLEPIFREPPLDAHRREGLRKVLGTLDLEELGRWVRRLDPERAGMAMAGGRQRILRTLEVALLSGRPLSWWHRHAEPDGAPVPLAVVALEWDAGVLATRIRARTAGMVADGLVDEVRGLLEAGVPPDAPGMTGTGYREVQAFLRGETDLPGMVRAIEEATRAYARRQRTWFRNQLPAETLRLEAGRPAEELLEEVVDFWRRRTGGAHGEPEGSGGGKG